MFLLICAEHYFIDECTKYSLVRSIMMTEVSAGDYYFMMIFSLISGKMNPRAILRRILKKVA